MKSEAAAQSEGERKERAIKAASISLAASGISDIGGGGGSIHLIRRSVSAEREMQQFKMNSILKNVIQKELRKECDQPSGVKEVEEEEVEEEEEEEEVVYVNNSIAITGNEAAVTPPTRVSRFGFVKPPLTSIAPR